MNATDRQRLARLYSLVDAVPFPASGTATTTAAGLSAYAQDMRYFRPRFKQVLLDMLYEDAAKHSDLSEGKDFDNVEDQIVELEKWVERKQAAGWERISESA